MAWVLAVRGKVPRWGKHCWFAPTATIIGDVELGDECSVWFGAVVRGDVNRIRIGNRVSIQDQVVIHCTYQDSETVVGDDVVIGHRAVLHGCTIASGVLVGIGAVLLDHVRVERGVIIAAGAVVPPGTHLASGYIYGGVPARALRRVDEEEVVVRVRALAQRYVMYARWYQGGGASADGESTPS